MGLLTLEQTGGYGERPPEIDALGNTAGDAVGFGASEVRSQLRLLALRAFGTM